jgi:superfamily II DNA or RNA helicase
MLRAIEDVRTAGRKSTILQAATGTGKTRTAAKWIKMGRKRKARFLFLAHRDILINQASSTFLSQGINFAVEQSDRNALRLFEDGTNPGVDVVIGSKDTMQGDRLARWPRDAFTDIITDEVHLATAKTYSNIYNHFDWGFHLGLSATPYRADGTLLCGPDDSLFGSGPMRCPMPWEELDERVRVHSAIAFKYTLPVAIGNGHLCDMIAVQCRTGIDVRGIRTTGVGHNKDFNLTDMSARISPLVADLAKEIRKQLDRLGVKKAVLFGPDVNACKAMSAALNAVGVHSVAVWSGSKKNPLTEDAQRAAMAEYEEGDARVICSCDMLRVGWDDEPTQAAIMLRLTMSHALFNQMIGRTTRIMRGKEKCYVIGFEWDGVDGAISTVDMFLEDEPDLSVRKKLKAKAKKAGTDFSVFDLLRESKREVDEERKAPIDPGELRIVVPPGDVSHTYKEFRPWNIGEILGVEVSVDRKLAKMDPPTPGQIEVLKSYGIRSVAGLSRAECDRIATECMDREFGGKASPEQILKLASKGYDPAEARLLDQHEAAQVIHRENLKISGRLKGWLKYMGYTAGQIEGFPKARAVQMYKDWAAAGGSFSARRR